MNRCFTNVSLVICKIDVWQLLHRHCVKFLWTWRWRDTFNVSIASKKMNKKVLIITELVNYFGTEESAHSRMVRQSGIGLKIRRSWFQSPLGAIFDEIFFALPCVKICQIIWQKRLSWKTQLSGIHFELSSDDTSNLNSVHTVGYESKQIFAFFCPQKSVESTKTTGLIRVKVRVWCVFFTPFVVWGQKS